MQIYSKSLDNIRVQDKKNEHAYYMGRYQVSDLEGTVTGEFGFYAVGE